jgi:LytS/YehU family sensor histidine kinase
MDVKQEVLDAQVPCLIMQPLVENAVKYAVAARAEGGTIQIRVQREGDVLRASVDDDAYLTRRTSMASAWRTCSRACCTVSVRSSASR